MHTIHKLALAAAGLAAGSQAAAQITFYENDRFQGRSFTTTQPVENLERYGFNDRASSVVVGGDRGERWEVCEDSRFRGRCVVVRPGQYASLSALGLNGRISSVRAVGRNERFEDGRYAPLPPPAPVAVPAPLGQIDLYENEGFRGRSFSATTPVPELRRDTMNDRASSAVVTGASWEVCQDARYSGNCVVLRPGQYPSLTSFGLGDRISSMRLVAAPVRVEAPPSASRIVFYEDEGFQGRAFTADRSVDDFRSVGFNDRASSVVVSGERWEVCQDARYGGTCAVLRPGQYPSVAAMGLNDRISSVRALGRAAPDDGRRYAPLPMVSHDYSRRGNERVYEANVTSVRAVVEDSGQRCWVEREQAVQEPQRGSPNVPGALVGAVIGGILGHQVGGGTGRDVATGLGVVAGAAIGSNVGRAGNDQQVVTTQNVQRCSTAPGQARPAYWDVTYNFRGQDYRVQMTRPPGATVTVNDQGEPRA